MKHLLLVAAIIYAVYTFAPSTPAPVVKTGPVADALRSATPQDKQTVASIYESLADITRRDGGKRISTTAEWRAVHQNTLGLAIGGTDLVGKYPGLDVAVEEVIGKHISLDNVALSSVVDDLVDACEEVAASAR